MSSDPASPSRMRRLYTQRTHLFCPTSRMSRAAEQQRWGFLSALTPACAELSRGPRNLIRTFRTLPVSSLTISCEWVVDVRCASYLGQCLSALWGWVHTRSLAAMSLWSLDLRNRICENPRRFAPCFFSATPSQLKGVRACVMEWPGKPALVHIGSI